MGIDIINLDEEAGVRHIRGKGRIEMMRRGDSVQPDGRIPNADFAMNRLALRGSMDAAGSEPERLDQEVVGSGNILIRQHWNDSLEGRHERLQDMSAPLSKRAA